MFISEARVGSYVKFGHYPQNDGDTPEPIEWQVLETDGKTALVISRYGLDCKQFHHNNDDIRWDGCDLRVWLNSEFLNRAFSPYEQKQIAVSKIYTGDNPDSGISGCGETQDKLFCLSIEEAWRYFGNIKENYGCAGKWYSKALNEEWWMNRERTCKPTAYAVLNGAVQSTNEYFKDKLKGQAKEWWFDNCWFWLRSPGSYYDYAAGVGDFGAVSCHGDRIANNGNAVRPALRIML